MWNLTWQSEYHCLVQTLRVFGMETRGLQLFPKLPNVSVLYAAPLAPVNKDLRVGSLHRPEVPAVAPRAPGFPQEL